jgi:HSP20 family molecular chaperone IbpA
MKLMEYGLFQLYKNLGVFGTVYDIEDLDDKIIFTMSVAGLRYADIDVRIRDGKRLIVRCSKDCKYTPPFYYAFSLPCEVIKEETFCTVKDGLLTVTIQKKESSEFKVALK